jgi:hypothetical protein
MTGLKLMPMRCYGNGMPYSLTKIHPAGDSHLQDIIKIAVSTVVVVA